MGDDRAIDVPDSGMELDEDAKTLTLYRNYFSYLNIILVDPDDEFADEASLLKISRKKKLTLSQ